MKANINTNYIYGCPQSVARSVFLALELMEADLSNHVILKDLARNARTNECTLKREFKLIFKTTIYQYLLNIRMRYAKNLLNTGHLREKEIALLCGFQSLAGFINSFRKYFGYTPGELKRRSSSVYT